MERGILKSNTGRRCNGERGAIEAVANRRGVDVAGRCVVDMVDVAWVEDAA